MAEFAKSLYEKEVETQHMGEKSVGTIILREPLLWKVYVDGVANQKDSRVGLVLISPEKITIER